MNYLKLLYTSGFPAKVFSIQKFIHGKPRWDNKSDPRYNILAHHTTPEQAAKVFNEVKPKLAAYSHIVKLYGRNEQEILKRTKENYSGPLVMGQDLMSFSISDTVIVNTWQNK